VRDSGHDPAKIRAVLGWMDYAIQDKYTSWEAEHLRQWAEYIENIEVTILEQCPADGESAMPAGLFFSTLDGRITVGRLFGSPGNS
jgi:hypothetical protein